MPKLHFGFPGGRAPGAFTFFPNLNWIRFPRRNFYLETRYVKRYSALSWLRDGPGGECGACIQELARPLVYSVWSFPNQPSGELGGGLTRTDTIPSSPRTSDLRV